MPELPAEVTVRIAKICRKTKHHREELAQATESRVRKLGLPLTIENGDAALVAICDERGVGAIARKVVGVREEMERGTSPESLPADVVEFRLGPNRILRHGPDLTTLVFVTHNGTSGKAEENPYDVIAGRFEPLKRQLIEGETYYTVEFAPGTPRTGTFGDLFDQLERVEGRILEKAHGKNVVAQLLYRLCKTTEVGWPTYGFYPNAEGHLVEIRSPTPIKDEQKKVSEQIASAVAYVPSREDIEAYAVFRAFYGDREVLPLFGLSAVSPFSIALRRERVLVPHSLAWSKNPHLGKTTVTFALSEKAWGRENATAPALSSEYRFPAHVDASCTPLAVEEAERFRWDTWSAELKTGAEGALLTKRGRKALVQESYLSRSVLFFSANTNSILSGPALARFFVLHFNERAKEERKQRREEFQDAFSKLKPIGPSVAREIAARYSTVQALVEAVDTAGTDIEKLAVGAGFQLGDPRRARAWGTCWVGLCAWRDLAETLDTKFPLPSLAEFVSLVVQPVEEATFEGEVTPLGAFRAWWEAWKVLAITRKFELTVGRIGRSGEDVPRALPMEEDSLKGDGRIFESGALELADGRKVPGEWVTTSVVGLYNRSQARADLGFSSLTDLSDTALREAGLHEELNHDARGLKRHAFRVTGPHRAAFIPEEGWGEESVRVSGRSVERQLSLSESSGHTGVRSCPVVSSDISEIGGNVHPQGLPDTLVSSPSTDDIGPTPDTRTPSPPLVREGNGGTERGEDAV